MSKPPEPDQGLPELLAGQKVLESYSNLPTEERSLITATIGVVLTPFKKLLEYFTLTNSIPDLAKLQEINRPRWRTLLSMVSTPAALLIATAWFSTDDLSYEKLTHLNYYRLDHDPKALITFVLDIPVVTVLLLFSWIFWIASVKYIAIFERDLINRPYPIISIATFLIWSLQGIACWQVLMGGSRLTYFAAAIVFLVAVALSQHLTLHITGEARKLQGSLDSRHAYRRFRLGYIIKRRVIQQVQQGWSSLNVVIFMALMALGFLRPLMERLYSEAIKLSESSPEILSVTKIASYVIIFLPLVFLLTGALRSFSAEGNKRHFHAVHIINSEFNMQKRGNPGEDLENKLREQSLYTIEDDPTITETRVMMPDSLPRTILGLALSARALSSLGFGAVIYILGAELLGAVQIVCALMISFLLNDLVDHSSGHDQIAHPNRPLPAGVITKTQVTVGISVLVIIMVVLGTQSQSTIGWSALLILAIGFIYSLCLKPQFPVTAVFLWCGSLAFAISAAAGFGYLGLLGVWTGALAREIVLDYRDRDADYLFNRSRNIAWRLGSYNWHTVGLMILTSIVLLVVETDNISLLPWALLGLASVPLCYHLEKSTSRNLAISVFSLASMVIWPLVLINA